MCPSLSPSQLLAVLLFLCSMPPKDKRANYQERVAKRRRVTADVAPGTSGTQVAQQHSPASRADAPGPSGLGTLNPELLAAINAAVTQALQAAAPSAVCSRPGGPKED